MPLIKDIKTEWNANSLVNDNDYCYLLGFTSLAQLFTVPAVPKWSLISEQTCAMLLNLDLF